MEGIEVEVQGADEGMEHTASKKVSSDSDLQEVWMMVNRRRQEKKKKNMAMECGFVDGHNMDGDR